MTEFVVLRPLLAKPGLFQALVSVISAYVAVIGNSKAHYPVDRWGRQSAVLFLRLYLKDLSFVSSTSRVCVRQNQLGVALPGSPDGRYTSIICSVIAKDPRLWLT